MECSHKNKAMKLRFFSGAAYRSKDKTAPRWRFHVQSVCADCGKHLKFLAQEPALIQQLDKNILIPDFLEGRQKAFKNLK